MALRTLTGEKLEAERARLALMREYEDTYAACTAICGIDEAGRGPVSRSGGGRGSDPAGGL